MGENMIWWNHKEHHISTLQDPLNFFLSIGNTFLKVLFFKKYINYDV
jgi:hypothetical protein